MGQLFVLGGVAVVAGTGLIYLCGRFTFPQDLPEDKIKKVIDDFLDPVATLGQMKRLYRNESDQTFKTAEKALALAPIEYVEMKIIHSCNLDSKRLPLSRLEKKVAEVGESVAAHLRSATGRVGSRTEPYDTLEEIKRKGEQLGAEAFSFNDAQMIHGDYVFNVLYHKSN